MGNPWCIFLALIIVPAVLNEFILHCTVSFQLASWNLFTRNLEDYGTMAGTMIKAIVFMEEIK